QMTTVRFHEQHGFGWRKRIIQLKFIRWFRFLRISGDIDYRLVSRNERDISCIVEENNLIACAVRIETEANTYRENMNQNVDNAFEDSKPVRRQGGSCPLDLVSSQILGGNAGEKRRDCCRI